MTRRLVWENPEHLDAVNRLFEGPKGASRLAAAVDGVLIALEEGHDTIRSLEVDNVEFDVPDEVRFTPVPGTSGGAVVAHPQEEDGSRLPPWVIVFEPDANDADVLIRYAGRRSDIP